MRLTSALSLDTRLNVYVVSIYNKIRTKFGATAVGLNFTVSTPFSVALLRVIITGASVSNYYELY